MTTATKISTRRHGSDTSKTREVLLNAAEELMRESGYAAVTSRRLANQAGLKPQLVHYYFPTMDQLFLDMFARIAERSLTGLDGILEAENPLRKLWDQTANQANVVLSYEFVGLANHRKDLRAAVAEHGNKLRARKIAVVHQILSRAGASDLPVTASLAVVFIDSLARNLALEAELGVHAGHAEAMERIESFFATITKGQTAASKQAKATAPGT